MIWRDTWTRMSGRHRRGEPVMPVPPRPWDVAKQAAARQLDLIEPAWTVWYGLGARRFYAVATWPAPEPLIVQARTADELCDLMREAEQATPSPTWLVPDGPAQPSPNRPVTGGPAQPPPVRLSVWAGTDELCVRVTDHGPDRPRHLDLGVEAAHGRGLTIVEALSDASGVTPLPDTPGKTVWARWRLFSPAANPSHATSPPGHRAHRGALSLPGPERNDRPR